MVEKSLSNHAVLFQCSLKKNGCSAVSLVYQLQKAKAAVNTACQQDPGRKKTGFGRQASEPKLVRSLLDFWKDVPWMFSVATNTALDLVILRDATDPREHDFNRCGSLLRRLFSVNEVSPLHPGVSQPRFHQPQTENRIFAFPVWTASCRSKLLLDICPS